MRSAGASSVRRPTASSINPDPDALSLTDPSVHCDSVLVWTTGLDQGVLKSHSFFPIFLLAAIMQLSP
jgi:hypothetical protein